MPDKKIKIDESMDSSTTLTTSDLKYILDVNKKAIEIYIEVDKQNEKILDSFEYYKSIASSVSDDLENIKNTQDKIEESLSEHYEYLKGFKDTLSAFKVYNEKFEEMIVKSEKKIEEIEKNLFRLVLILGSSGAGLIATIISTYLKK